MTVREAIHALTDAELAATLAVAEDRYFPEARDKQRPPEGDWQAWLVLAGRGWGKTRIGAEWLLDQALKRKGDYAIAARTFADGRDICVEGALSGLLAVCRRRGVLIDRRAWNRSIGEVRLPNGSKFKLLSADEPDRARGWNFSAAWCDELASWRYPDAFTQLRLALRVGDYPRMVVTTTPKPVPLLIDLMERPSTITVRGSTWENAANLSDAALEEFRERYAGTRIGRQELEAELLTDVPGALWTRDLIDHAALVPGLDRVVVAVDPAGTAHEHSDETGIIVAGRAGRDGFVVADHSGRYSPDGWGRETCLAYVRHHADAVVFEKNQGWDMGPHIIRSSWANLVREGKVEGPEPRVVAVAAQRNKQARAEPLVAQYEQGRWHHVGSLAELEDQMCSWVPGESRSPDRVDALVWAAWILTVNDQGRSRVVRTRDRRLPSVTGV